MSISRDQVFQLSLTEIAFTLIFILLLLMGWMLTEADQRQADLETAITEASEAQYRQAQLEDARRLAEMEAKAALALKKDVEQQLQEQLGVTYPKGSEAALARDLVAAAKQAKEQARELRGVADERAALADKQAGLAAENADLRGQVAFLKGKLEANGGRDFPPCWAEEGTGRVEYLFSIEILPEGLKISRAWPAKRQANAEALPNIEKLTGASPISLEKFNALLQGIDRESKEKNCRHYVMIKNRVKDLEEFNRYRYGIENHFYKFELRH